MASIKQAFNPASGVNKETFINGILTGGTIYGVAQAVKKIQENRRMRKQLAQLEDLAQRELAKDDISLAGDFFKDRYPHYTKQAANADKPAPTTPAPNDAPRDKGLHSLPAWAWLLTGAGAGYAGTGIIHELLTKKKPAQTPSFAVEYRKQRQKEFERAARLLRAVTDAPTWKDVAMSEKNASFSKEASWLSKYIFDPIANFFGNLNQTVEEAKGVSGAAKKKIDEVGDNAKGHLNTFFSGVNDYALPAIYAASIAGAGYLGYKGLNKLLYAIRKYKNRANNDDAAANAWVAARKDIGEPGKVLNTYIENDDSDERKELNKLLAAYESRYQK